MSKPLVRSILGAVALTGLLATSLPASAAYDGLVVFGDSLSDTGRVFAASGFPPAPYWQGRFSNGPVAVEYLATGLGLGSGQVLNLAVGGARTGWDGSAGANTGMSAQLAGFQLLTGGLADASSLYFVWGGANDLRNGVSIDTAVGNLKTIVGTLYGMGAREFLLPNLPDLGLTPEARANGAMGMALATGASELFNAKLASAYGELAAAWSDEHFHFFDAMASQRAITSGSPANGFTDVSSNCLTVGLACTPDSFLYWDNIHPTAAAHEILGGQMLAAAVPEPATLLTMGLGVLALLGLSARRGVSRG